MVEIANNQGADMLTKPYEISVNNKPVSLAEPIVTGLEIKEVAIEQGLPIDTGFQLARVEADGKHYIVGDTDKVDVRESKTFFATAPDDNA